MKQFEITITIKKKKFFAFPSKNFLPVIDLSSASSFSSKLKRESS